MIVSKIRKLESRHRVEGEVQWEDVDRQSVTVFFECAPSHQFALAADPNAFLVGTVLPAWHGGERRVSIEAPVCPILLDQIRAPLATLSKWYPELGPPPILESDGLESVRRPEAGAISFLSCGVDSLATLRANRLWYPRDHPLSIATCVLIDYVNEKRALDEVGYSNFDALKVDAAERVCSDVGATPVVLRSNLWSLDDDGEFFTKASFGAFLASNAHCFSQSHGAAFIAASLDAHHATVNAGSSSLLDPYYSSSQLQVFHHGAYMTRLERTRLVADWPVGLDNLRVCVNDVRGTGNCGTCEKCIRTKLTLVALGKLDETSAFVDDMNRDLLAMVIEYRMIWVRNLLDGYFALIPLLEAHGRIDLVEGIGSIVADFDRREAAGDV